MKISIIVPVYNKEEYIRQCLDSLTGQTFKDLEIVLVDGGSVDKSADICDEYASRDSRIKVLRTKSTGPADSVRQGVEAASGDYFAFVDSDDWIDTDMMEKLAAHTTDCSREIILSDYIIERSGGAQTYIYQDVEPGEYLHDRILKEIIPRLWGLETRAVSQSRCMKLFSKELVKRNINYPEPDMIFAEDGAFTIPCVLDAGRMYFMDHEAMYHYRQVSDSSVHRYKPQMTKDIFRAAAIAGRAIDDKFRESDAALCDRLHEMYKPEKNVLLVFAIKNELLGELKTCIKNIRSICLDPDNIRIIRDPEYRVEYKNTYSRMIVFVMKHPARSLITILYMIQKIDG